MLYWRKIIVFLELAAKIALLFGVFVQGQKRVLLPTPIYLTSLAIGPPLNPDPTRT